MELQDGLNVFRYANIEVDTGARHEFNPSTGGIAGGRERIRADVCPY